MMETVRTSEMSVYTETTRRYIAEVSILQSGNSVYPQKNCHAFAASLNTG
jgi:hypothetical protein